MATPRDMKDVCDRAVTGGGRGSALHLQVKEPPTSSKTTLLRCRHVNPAASAASEEAFANQPGGLTKDAWRFAGLPPPARRTAWRVRALGGVRPRSRQSLSDAVLPRRMETAELQ